MRYWFAVILLETLAGRRPAFQMIKHTTAVVYEQLWQLAAEGRLRARPGRAGPQVMSFHGEPRWPGVIEVAARVALAGRSRALAFRLERGTDARWRCTALETR